MKIKIVMLLNLMVIGLITNAQDSCKVLVNNLQGTYYGDCKKGLAHGKGEAKGIDSYSGLFRKGYPHGKGKYVWANGSTYEGEWNMGMREGEGIYSGSSNGKENLQDGIWKEDAYVGPKPMQPIINEKKSITSTNFARKGDGEEVIIRIVRNGMPVEIVDLNITANSGSEFKSGNNYGFQNIIFPFACKITYKCWNQFRFTLIDCTLDFEIKQPGKWDIRLDN